MLADADVGDEGLVESTGDGTRTALSLSGRDNEVKSRL